MKKSTSICFNSDDKLVLKVKKRYFSDEEKHSSINYESFRLEKCLRDLITDIFITEIYIF